VITTAAIPGKKSPTLVTGAAVESMAPGSVIVDLGAERGGNCELTQANQSIIKYGVTILGPTNLPAEVPFHASQMFANNITKFLLNMVKKGVLEINTEDEIVRETLLAQGGQVVNSRIISLLAPAEK
jgi:NAD(P) transhydrogenase subunit alpha